MKDAQLFKSKTINQCLHRSQNATSFCHALLCHAFLRLFNLLLFLPLFTFNKPENPTSFAIPICASVSLISSLPLHIERCGLQLIYIALLTLYTK